MLRQVLIPDDDNFDDNFKGAKLQTIMEKKPLFSTKPLSSVFPDGAPPGHCHIVVSVPLAKKGVKHTRSPSDESNIDRLKRTKLATTAPSLLATAETYEDMQNNPSERILDDRPTPDEDIPPIPLLYDGFGQFLDIFHGSADVPGLSNVNRTKLRGAVDTFANEMCLIYQDENEWRDVALQTVDRIFSRHKNINIPPLCVAAIGSVRSRGYSTGSHGVPVLVMEVKNRPVGTNTYTEVQCVAHVARLHARAMDNCQDMFERWRVPCLGLTIIGAYVQFYAIIALGSRYRLVSLTSSMSCILSATDGHDQKLLYNAFTAALVLQARILQDIREFLHKPLPKITAGRHDFPAISRLRKYRSSSDAYLTFEIRERYHDYQSHRLLYIAEAGEHRILVKFTRTYSLELHEFCARCDLAPKILAFEKLYGGWLGIAMAYIPSANPIIDSPQLGQHIDKWRETLTTLVNNFHNVNLVHGDLRDPNIICDDMNHIWLVDFDWGGQDGRVFYPTPNLNPELLEGRTSDDLRVTKEDDQRVLKNTLAKLKRQADQTREQPSTVTTDWGVEVT